MSEENKATIRKIVREEIDRTLVSIILGMFFVGIVVGLGMWINS